MTRINVGLKSRLLNDKMLLGEIRELPRVLNKAKQGKYKSKPIDKFTLNKGHELSTLNKLSYLVNRHKNLVAEAKNRGFNIMDYTSSYKDLPPHLYNDYKPTVEDRKLIVERISERLDNMRPKDIRYYGEIVDKEHFKILMAEL